MAQATYSIRLDKEKKAEFDQICERLGLSVSSAFSTFVNKTIEKKGLPYELVLEKTPADYGILEESRLTREELAAEIQKGVDSAKQGKVYSADEVFAELLEEEYEKV